MSALSTLTKEARHTPIWTPYKSMESVQISPSFAFRRGMFIGSYERDSSWNTALWDSIIPRASVPQIRPDSDTRNKCNYRSRFSPRTRDSMSLVIRPRKIRSCYPPLTYKLQHGGWAQRCLLTLELGETNNFVREPQLVFHVMSYQYN